MPYPNEHSARIQDPNNYVRFRRQNDKFGDGIHAIFGIPESGGAELQAIRFDAKKYSVAEAKRWLDEHDIDYIAFEPASGENSRPRRGEMERRVIDADLRVADGDGRRRLAGYAALYESESEDLGWFVERIAPGAFRKALEKDPDVRALVNHDPNLVLGRTRAGTLVLREDEKGLACEIILPDTQVARDLAVSVERGDVDQMSFAFRIGEEGEEWDNSRKPPVRTIREIDELYDVSVVTYPAYPDTSVALRRWEVEKERRLRGAARNARRRRQAPLVARLQTACRKARERKWIS